jgi:hypothetical protein
LHESATKDLGNHQLIQFHNSVDRPKAESHFWLSNMTYKFHRATRCIRSLCIVPELARPSLGKRWSSWLLGSSDHEAIMVRFGDGQKVIELHGLISPNAGIPGRLSTKFKQTNCAPTDVI